MYGVFLYNSLTYKAGGSKYVIRFAIKKDQWGKLVSTVHISLYQLLFIGAVLWSATNKGL